MTLSTDPEPMLLEVTVDFAYDPSAYSNLWDTSSACPTYLEEHGPRINLEWYLYDSDALSEQVLGYAWYYRTQNFDCSTVFNQNTCHYE